MWGIDVEVAVGRKILKSYAGQGSQEHKLQGD